MITYDFFDTVDAWSSDPLVAFTTFVKSDDFLLLSRRVVILEDDGKSLRPMRKSAITVYVAMFAKYLRWLDGLDFRTVSAAEIIEFLDHREVFNGKDIHRPSSLIRLRYLRLLERVYQHLEITPNPASYAIRVLSGQQAIGKDAAKVALTVEQQDRFMLELPFASQYKGSGDVQDWKRRRDRAMQSLMLGAGLTVAEVIGLYIENIGTVDITGSVPVTVSPGSVDGTGRWHQTQLRPFAVKEVMDWVAERKSMEYSGKLLFPASLMHTGPLNKATVYRQVNATFKRAGLEIPRKGGRTLRNSFAARELSNNGSSIELVGEFLGLRRIKSTIKYIPKKANNH
jgi:integrase/recombinase XerD